MRKTAKSHGGERFNNERRNWGYTPVTVVILIVKLSAKASAAAEALAK